MTVMNFLKVYKVDDKELDMDEEKFLTVQSDRFGNDMVCLSLDNEQIITVNADELIKAVKNATNH